MADPADAAENQRGPSQTPTLAAMMSAFSMFPQEEAQKEKEAPSPEASSQLSVVERSPQDDMFRRMIVPSDAPFSEVRPRLSPARFGAVGTWQLSASPITIPPAPAPMRMASPAPAPKMPEAVVTPEESEPAVPEPDCVPETAPEPPHAFQGPPEKHTEPGRIAPPHHPPAANLPPLPDRLPLYAHEPHALVSDPLMSDPLMSDLATQALVDAERLPPPSITGVPYETSDRLDVLPMPAGPPLLARLIVWQIATAATLVLALAAGVVAFAPHGQAPITSVAAIGVVNAPAPLYLAEIDSAAVLRLTALATIAVPNGRDLQLWIIPPGDQTPTSLGVLPSRGTVVTLQAVPSEGTRFVISMEPRGGTTAGRITGQVLYGGTLANR